MILALDASSAIGSVALVNDGEIVREISVPTPRGRGGALFAALQDILAHQPKLDRVVVGTGPGSYNGIRSAISVAWGIARAHGAPLVGISSLLGLGEGSYVAVGDARRGQSYFAVVNEGRFVAEPVLCEQNDLAALVKESPAYAPEAVAFFPSATVKTPAAARLAVLSANYPPLSAVPEPLYLKPAHITTPSKG